MKILSITIHNVPNFGSVLQTLATQMLFEKKRCDIEVIDYCPPRLRIINRIKCVFGSKASLLKKIVVFLTMDVLNKRVFSSFLKKRVHLTKCVYNTKDVMKKLCVPDIYMTGSDQVWNSGHNGFIDTTYYFESVPGKKVSFASSFGRDELNREESILVKKMLLDYEIISIRENSGKKILMNLLPSKNIEQIIDPTLLIPADEWRKIATHSSDTQERYVLIYPMSGIDFNLFDVAKKIASRIGAKIKMLSPGLKTYKQCDCTLKFQSPERFLELIDNAACVVTNSFHGTAFSINFETPFVTLMPQKYSTRLDSILTLLEQKNRIWNEHFNYADVLNIDFSKTKKILNEERAKANLFIERIIQI